MNNVRKMIINLVCLGILLGSVYFLLISRYGSTATIPIEDLIAFNFWLLVAATGILVLDFIESFFIEGPQKKRKEPPKVLKKISHSNISPESRETLETPQQWKEEEFE